MSSEEQLLYEAAEHCTACFHDEAINSKLQVITPKIEKRGHTLESILGMGNSLTGIAGVKVDPTSALAYSAVYACIDAIAGDLASISLNVYERLPNGGKAKAVDHPTWKLLHDWPNDELTSDEFRYALISNCLRWGNGYAEIERTTNGGIPLALHLIPPQSVNPKRNRSGKLYYEITSGKGGKIAVEDMIHIKCLGSPEGDLGFSPITQAKEAISLGLAAEQFGAAYFGNSARPGGVITFPHTLDETAIKNLRESIQAVHGGAKNFGKWMIVEEGGSITPYSIPPNDSQFLETRIFQIQEICRFYRVPSSIINENSKNTFTNSIEEGLRYVTHCLRRWAVRIEKQISKKLYPDGDFFCEFLIDSLLRGDPATRTSALKTQLLNGALTVDEWREIENRNPVEDPKKHYMQGQMRTLADIEAGTKEEPQIQEPQQEPPEPQPEPPEKEEKSHTQELECRAVATTAALKLVLEDTLGRMARRQFKAVQNAAKHPREFLSRLDKFYDSHKPFMTEAIKPSLRAWLVSCGRDPDPDKEAEALSTRDCTEAHGSLIELSGEVTTDGLIEAVDKWVRNRSGKVDVMITEDKT